MGAQDRLDGFYSIDNLVSFDIVMDDATWAALLAASPVNVGKRNDDGTYDMPIPPARHYEWVTADSVTISTSKNPNQSTRFDNVGVVKKAWYGSLSYSKPGLKLDLSKFNTANEAIAKGLFGTDHFILNNSKQDPAYVRQPLGYELFRQAGVPSFRCNFASVKVNGKFWGGKDRDGTLLPEDGVYVNLEAMKKKFAQRAFNTDKGTAYEIGYLDDLVPDRLSKGYLSYQGFSDKFSDRTDLLRAAQAIKDDRLAGARKVIDLDAFILFYAMEVLTLNFDGYNQNQNNTYMYNTADAKIDPQVEKGDIKFQFIPCGIDQCLRFDRGMVTSDKSVLSQLVLADKDMRAELINQIRLYANDIFGPKNYQNNIAVHIERATATLAAAHAQVDSIEFESVKNLVQNIHAWAFVKFGVEKIGTIQEWF